jgi:hypothetical protein
LLTISHFLFSQQIASDPIQNIFNYKYEPVSECSNKTGKELIVLSDLIRYSDAYRILAVCYGDGSSEHKLEPDFGKKYPEIVKKYFSNIDNIPDLIHQKLRV